MTWRGYWLDTAAGWRWSHAVCHRQILLQYLLFFSSCRQNCILQLYFYCLTTHKLRSEGFSKIFVLQRQRQSFTANKTIHEQKWLCIENSVLGIFQDFLGANGKSFRKITQKPGVWSDPLSVSGNHKLHFNTHSWRHCTVVWKLKLQLVLGMARAKNTLFIFYFQYFLWVLKLHIPLQNVRHH